MKLNQKGILDIVILGIVGVVVIGGVVVFARSLSIRNRQDSKITDNTNSEGQSIDEIQQTITEESIDQPQDNQSPVTNTSQPAPPAPSSPTPRQISFSGGVKGGGAIQWLDIVLRGYTNEQLNGTCTYYLSLGSSVITKTNQSGAQSCEIYVPLTSIPIYGTWNITINYTSSDGSAIGSVTYSEDIYPETFYFTKGGGDFDGLYVYVSETATYTHTGVCKYIFTKGSQRVEKSNSITNSRTCSINIHKSEFPSTGTWDYDLNFTNTEYFEVGIGGGWGIDIY